MRAAMRAAAVSLLEGYRTANAGSLRQVYGARPKSIAAPSAFVDSINEGQIDYSGHMIQRTPDVIIRLVRGTFATEDVAGANDDLVDGFITYVSQIANRDAAGAHTLSLVTSVEDDDGWIPEWLPESQPFYSTLVTLSGEGAFGAL
jgi:hypothetical protein